MSSLVFQILFHQSFSERREKHTILYKVLPNKRWTKESCKSRIELFVTIVKRFKVINYYHKKRPSFDVEKYLNPPIAFRTDSISKSKTKEQRLFEIKWAINMEKIILIIFPEAKRVLCNMQRKKSLPESHFIISSFQFLPKPQFLKLNIISRLHLQLPV